MSSFLIGLLQELLAAELLAWCAGLARKIIGAAAASMPPSLQARMLEEWHALLDDTPADLSKLWVACSLYWKRTRIAHECEEPGVMPIPTQLLDKLTDEEDIVLQWALRGKSDGEIANYLSCSRTTVEYYKLRCAQKLSGQCHIGRNDLLRFFRSSQRYSRSTFQSLMNHYRRARMWRQVREERPRHLARLPHEKTWKRNGGW